MSGSLEKRVSALELKMKSPSIEDTEQSLVQGIVSLLEQLGVHISEIPSETLELIAESACVNRVLDSLPTEMLRTIARTPTIAPSRNSTKARARDLTA